MTGEQFTQIKRPVSRLTEKVLGWLCWVMLLVLTIITMFIALVSFSNNTSIANLENTLNNNAFIQQLLAGNGYNTTQFVIWLQNGIWAIIVYFIVCLLISFLALISMNIRILSGFLFLISAFVTIPLILLIVTLIIPILFFIIAMMMFIRKDKVEMVGPQYYEGFNEPYYDYREPVYERPQPKEEYYDEPKHESEAEKAHTVYDQEKDKYDQFPKRAVESEYNTVETSEGEPSVLSRQAKYKQKSTEELGIEDDGYYAEPEVDPKELKAQQKEKKLKLKLKRKKNEKHIINE